MHGLLYGRKDAAIGKDGQHYKEVKRFKPLLCVELKMLPEVIAFFGAHGCANVKAQRPPEAAR